MEKKEVTNESRLRSLLKKGEDYLPLFQKMIDDGSICHCEKATFQYLHDAIRRAGAPKMSESEKRRRCWEITAHIRNKMKAGKTQRDAMIEYVNEEKLDGENAHFLIAVQSKMEAGKSRQVAFCETEKEEKEQGEHWKTESKKYVPKISVSLIEKIMRQQIKYEKTEEISQKHIEIVSARMQLGIRK